MGTRCKRLTRARGGPYATLYLNRPSGKSISHKLTSAAEVAQIIADEFNQEIGGSGVFPEYNGYTHEQVLVDLEGIDLDVIEALAESSFGRGFLLGQGMLIQLYKENPTTFDEIVADDDDDGQ